MNDLNVKSEPTPTPQDEFTNPDKPMSASQDKLAGPNQPESALRDDFTDLDEPDDLPDSSESASQSAKLGDTQPVDLATAWRQWLQLAMSELEDRCQDEANQYLQVFRYIDLDDSTYTSLETCGATTTLACPRPFLSIFWSVFMDLRRYGFHHGNRRETDCRLRLVTRVLRKLSVATTSPDPIPSDETHITQVLALYRVLLRLILVSPPVGIARDRAGLLTQWLSSFISWLRRVSEFSAQIPVHSIANVQELRAECRPTLFTPSQGYHLDAPQTPPLSPAYLPVPDEADDRWFWARLQELDFTTDAEAKA